MIEVFQIIEVVQGEREEMALETKEVWAKLE